MEAGPFLLYPFLLFLILASVGIGDGYGHAISAEVSGARRKVVLAFHDGKRIVYGDGFERVVHLQQRSRHSDSVLSGRDIGRGEGAVEGRSGDTEQRHSVEIEHHVRHIGLRVARGLHFQTLDCHVLALYGVESSAACGHIAHSQGNIEWSYLLLAAGSEQGQRQCKQKIK